MKFEKRDSELSKLFNLDELYLFYSMIGETLNTDIDLQNSGFDRYIQSNTIILLEKCDFIRQVDDIFIKNKQYNDIDSFSVNLLDNLQIIYSDSIAEILSLDKKYDENRDLFYLSKNKVDTKYSGLLMLLDDLSFLQIISRKVYILSKKEIRKISTDISRSKKLISIIELEQSLVIKKELGEIAERKALEYELSLLNKCGISGKPKIISHIDASAGYDMVSYFDKGSVIYDKFIEVKSCQNETQHFYLSSNELTTAKEKGDSYYIYLYIRDTDEIIPIRNPYKQIYLSETWAKEPQIYKIYKSPS